MSENVDFFANHHKKLTNIFVKKYKVDQVWVTNMNVKQSLGQTSPAKNRHPKPISKPLPPPPMPPHTERSSCS
jgi:hypothetical protein